MAIKKLSESIESKIHPVGDVPQFLVMAIYGRAGTGKTAFASTFPKPLLLLDVRERGTETIANVPGIDVLNLTKWEEFEETYWFLKKDGHKKYKTIIIDHLSQLQAVGMERVRERENMDSDEMFTKRNWGSLSGMMQTWIFNYRQLWDSNMHVGFIAHERANTGEEGTEDQIDPSIGPRLMPSAASFLNGCVSTIGNTFIREVEIGPDKEKKVQFCMRVGPHAVYAAKIRRPVDSEAEIPSIIVNPTFEKIIQLSRGESILKRKKAR